VDYGQPDTFNCIFPVKRVSENPNFVSAGWRFKIVFLDFHLRPCVPDRRKKNAALKECRDYKKGTKPNALKQRSGCVCARANAPRQRPPPPTAVRR
jgi:hypothetical protein